MSQLSKGDTFADGQQLTAARLNQLIDSGQVLVGAITEQTAVTANTLEATDAILVSDAGVLKKATIGDVVGSGLPIATSSITAQANKDVVITSNDGVVVTGSTYVSADAITVTVTTAVAHGLSVNQVVQIYGAGTGYNGVFKITAVTSLTFTYVLSSLYSGASVTITPTACSYYTKATNRVSGHSTISGNQYASGVVTPYLEVETQALFNLSVSKTSNVTTAMQFSGTPVMGLVSVTETAIPFAQCDATTSGGLSTTCNQWRPILTLTGQTKTARELWQIEADFVIQYYSLFGTRFRIVLSSTSGVYAMEQNFAATSPAMFFITQIKMKAIIPEGVAFTADSIRIEMFYAATFVNGSSILNVGFGGALTDNTITRVARITKFIKP